MTYESILAAQGIEVKSAFVPFSRSRNKDESRKSLNWVVTVYQNGMPVLSTDYMAGEGHCPSYRQNARRTLDYDRAIEHECETGTAARPMHGIGHMGRGRKIEPNPCDVIYSLIMDSDVINHAGFEDWANEFGYDTDSRAAKKTYDACMKIALQFRAGLGDEKIRTLAEAFQDY